MKDKEQHIGWIRMAELQFRLACTVDVAVVNDEQSLEMEDGQRLLTMRMYESRPNRSIFVL